MHTPARRTPAPAAPAAHPPPGRPSPVEAARERLVAHGPEALSPAELLTILLAPGGRGPAAETGARRLLARFAGDLRALAGAPVAEVVAGGRVPPALAARLAAAFALGRRVHAARLKPGMLVRAGAEVHEAFGGRLRDLKKERFISVLLDGRRRVIREEVVSEGILTASLVHPREVFAPAIREAAGAILLVHNHPSGDPEPSPEDVEITRRLRAVGELVGIHVVDHVVIGDGRYVSFLERGLL